MRGDVLRVLLIFLLVPYLFLVVAGAYVGVAFESHLKPASGTMSWVVTCSPVLIISIIFVFVVRAVSKSRRRSSEQ